MIEWLEATYTYRLLLGVAFFTVLGVVDLVRHPEDPKRVKEYLFVLFAGALAVLYGEIHDQITVTISPGYFVKFKGLGGAPGHIRQEVALLALKASYGPGLIAGALLVIANNPSKKLEQLPYARLARLTLIPLGCAALGALGGALLAYLAPPAEVLETAQDTFLPAFVRPFVLVWGIHMGSYCGAALGTLTAVVLARRSRVRTREVTIKP